MNKSKKLIIVLLTLFFLTACGNQSLKEKLQENEWKVISDNGESYNATFLSDTASFDSQLFSLGFTYTIDDDEITLKDEEDEEIFIISKTEKKELYFEAKTEKTLKSFGNLTMTPIEK